MVKQTTVGERQAFYERHVAGMSYEQIAALYGRSKECVRYWCRRQRDGGSCQSAYQRTPAGLLRRFDPKVRYCILRLRLTHPRWGPASILLHLRKRRSLRGLALPSVAAIGRYLHQWARFRRAPRRQAAASPRPEAATAVHERWQLDFKVKIGLDDGSFVHLLNACDETSGACLGGLVLAAPLVAQTVARIQESQVRAFLRSLMARWQTLPDAVQTDSESTLVAPAKADAFPSYFTMWLVALGIAHQVIRRGKPTDNAEVERCHRTLNDYAVVGNEDKRADQLQTIVEQAVEELLYERPSRGKACAGRPPAVAYPQLGTPRRPFRPAQELAAFDLARVDAFLATFTWRRRAGKYGQVAIGQQRRYSIGRKHGSREVLVRFDPADRHFVFYDAAEPQRLLARRPARGLEVADILDIAPWPAGPGIQQLPLPFVLVKG